MERQTKKVAMPTDLKTKNRKRILDAFRATGEKQVTLNEISEITGISRQTIMKSIGYFLDLGIVQNLGKGISSELGGKRPELYQFHADYRYVVCIRVGHRSLMVAVMNLSMGVVDQIAMDHARNEKLDVILDNFKVLYRELLDRTGISEADIIGAGVCVSGICNQTTGIMRYNSVYPSWGTDIPIVDKFRGCLPEHFKLYITNETKLTAMAELYFQPELKNKRIVVVLTHGGGISAAYVSKGKVIDGTNALAGEIGHLTVDPHSEEVCSCGLKGCLEKVVSEETLMKEMQMGLVQHPESMLSDFIKANQYRLGDVIRKLTWAADAGDPLALEVTEYMAFYISIGLKGILLNLDPDVLIVQGYYTNCGKAFKEALCRQLSKFKYFSDDISEVFATDKREVNQLAITGIGYALLERYFAEDELYLQ